MYHLRRIIFFSITFLIFSCSYAHAQMVQITDSGAYHLFERMNRIAQDYKSDLRIDDFRYVGLFDGSLYDIYIATAGAYGHAALVTFYCNKAGYVSKITVTCSMNDSSSAAASSNATNLLLSALGISKSEHDVLTGPQLSKKFISDVWCAKNNRRIVLEMLPDTSQNIFYVRLTAYDN